MIHRSAALLLRRMCTLVPRQPSQPRLHPTLVTNNGLSNVMMNSLPIARIEERSERMDRSKGLACIMEDVEEGYEYGYFASSTLKKRRLKMNRHKYRKRRKRDRQKSK